MAITEILPGIEVTVEINGDPLEELEDPHHEELENTVTRYIPAVTGKEFIIKVEMKRGFEFQGDALSALAFADGRLADHMLFQKRDAEYGRTIICDGFDDYPNLIKFKFSELEIISDGRKMPNEEKRLRELGCLSIDFYHSNTIATTDVMEAQEATKEVGIVSEKAIKGRAVSHGIGFGSTVASRAETVTEVEYVSGDHPFATLDFHYRSLAALKTLRIIEYTPAPKPLEEKEFDELTAEDLRELHRRAIEAKDREAASTKIKREVADANPRPWKAVRPGPDDTQMEMDEDGEFHEVSNANLAAAEREVIMLDD